jgi:predicted P-loop ATPase
MFRLPPQPRYILITYAPNDKGKTDKFPLNPHNLQKHDAQDPAIWMDLETAKNIMTSLSQTHQETYGIGFVFIPDDRYYFIDIDDCLENNATWSKTADDVCSLFAGRYMEVSNSGKGLHIIGRYEGAEPIHGCKNIKEGIEFYTSGRFCAITMLNATGDSQLVDNQKTIETFTQRYGLHKNETTFFSDEWTTESLEGCNPPDDNSAIIELIKKMPKSASQIFQGKQHAEFIDLFEANEKVLSALYPSQSGDSFDRSSADSALAYRLHYFLGGNCERVKQIMEMSSLRRDKWERSDYLPRTILSARGKQTKCFVHHRPTNDSTEDNQCKYNIRILSKNHYPQLNETFTKPLDTTANLKFLLDKLEIRVRWNDMTRLRDVFFKNVDLFNDDKENDALTRIKDVALLNGLAITRIDEQLDNIAQQDNYHPIVDAVLANPWDGIPRMESFIKTLKTNNDTLANILIKRWLFSAIAAAFSEKGFSSHGILVLVGKQSLGKTKWIKALDPLDINAVREGGFLDPTNKDCLITFASHWIIELGELDGTLRKTDIARLKSHVTSSIDVVRRPWMRKDSRFARRTVYAASVNDSRFLTDVTGNRRFWTLPVTSINNDHGLDMLQVWAEIYHCWKIEKQTWLSKEEEDLLNELNSNHEQIEPFEEKLFDFYDFSEGWQQRETEKRTSTGVLNSLGYQNVSRSDATRMSHIIRKITKTEPKRRFHILPKFTPPKY